MKRFLIVLLLSGCSPSVVELRAKRLEVEVISDRLNNDLAKLRSDLQEAILAESSSDPGPPWPPHTAEECRYLIRAKTEAISRVLVSQESVNDELEELVIVPSR